MSEMSSVDAWVMVADDVDFLLYLAFSLLFRLDELVIQRRPLSFSSACRICMNLDR